MRLFAATMAIAMLLAPAALGAPSIAGNFQGWDPADPASELTLNGNGVYELTIAAGDSFVADYGPLGQISFGIV